MMGHNPSALYPYMMFYGLQGVLTCLRSVVQQPCEIDGLLLLPTSFRERN